MFICEISITILVFQIFGLVGPTEQKIKLLHLSRFRKQMDITASSAKYTGLFCHDSD